MKSKNSNIKRLLNNRIIEAISEALGHNNDFCLYLLGIRNINNNRALPMLDIGIITRNILSYSDIYHIEKDLHQRIQNLDIHIIDINKLNNTIKKYAIDTSSKLLEIYQD